MNILTGTSKKIILCIIIEFKLDSYDLRADNIERESPKEDLCTIFYLRAEFIPIMTRKKW